ncbi:type I-F CRISPR-associated protein Csy2 [Aeromonas veronii]|uniref:type I-F CRISPR-associated protein Csy2 n=1 Tax=Aeromonas veronii TaxID=654 RepID=UPI00244372A0|nr:type I-F CRISPR-associated protein Csy2 [Aeromonas veronii]
MKSTLLLRHLKVENANAISGLTYGFPAISHFLGFTHALSRRLEQAFGLTLGGLRSHRSSHRVTESAAWQPP